MKELIEVETGSDFSGVGAFEQAMLRAKIEFKTVYACDMDKFARQSYIANYGEPEYYPENVYDRVIPEKSLDIYMTSPPCQSFSLAGKRKGKDSKNGVLFFNSHEFIQKNKPRFFIFENVKGLLSDDKGKTFSEWCNMLGGKSINGTQVMFPYPDSVPYHIYFKVLNSKKYGIPQNRERVFIVGIRDDKDNDFTWPKEVPLKKKLKDVLEKEVESKYYLSEKMIKGLMKGHSSFKGRFNPFSGEEENANCITTNAGSRATDNFIKIVGNTNPSGGGQNGNVYDEEGISPTLSTNKGEGIKIKSATILGYETAKEGDSINFTHPNSETRRGRVGKGVAQTLDTACNQAVCVPVSNPSRKTKDQNGRRFKEDGEEMFTLTTQDTHGVFNGHVVRRLTPRECFRLQDFPDSFKFVCSDSQLYKQAGNSISVGVLEKIISKFKL